jgi:hypothetical protein
MRIAREEIFRPVLTVIAYHDEDEAVAIANDSDYGLAGSVFTTDTDRGLAIAARIHTGTFGINQGYIMDPLASFGGVKAADTGANSAARASTATSAPSPSRAPDTACSRHGVGLSRILLVCKRAEPFECLFVGRTWDRKSDPERLPGRTGDGEGLEVESDGPDERVVETA